MSLVADVHAMSPRCSVAVYCAASAAIEPHFSDAARTIGRALIRTLAEWPFGVLVVVVCAVCLAITLGVGRLTKRLPQHDESGLLIVVCSTFGIIIAFIIFAQWNANTRMVSTIETESDSLASIIRYAQTFDSSGAVNRVVLDYRDAAVGAEIPALRAGELDTAWKAGADKLDELVATIEGVAPPTGTKSFYELAVSQIDNLTAARRDRIQFSQSTLPASLGWFVVISVVIMLTLVPLVRPADSLYSVLMLAAVAIFYGLALSLVITLNYPLNGPLSVSVDRFFTGKLAG